MMQSLGLLWGWVNVMGMSLMGMLWDWSQRHGVKGPSSMTP